MKKPGAVLAQAQLLTHLDYALAHTDWKGQRDKDNQDALARFAPFIKPMKQAQQELSALTIN
ncbi:hypothetical protein, partial [Xenorhabdus bovienii]